jgi:hypothetical protein
MTVALTEKGSKKSFDSGFARKPNLDLFKIRFLSKALTISVSVKVPFLPVRFFNFFRQTFFEFVSNGATLSLRYCGFYPPDFPVHYCRYMPFSLQWAWRLCWSVLRMF